MDLMLVRELVKLVEASDIDELEVSRWGRRIRITKNRNASEPEVRLGGTTTAHALAAAQPAAPALAPPRPEETKKLVNICAPMVGTFYRAPAPDARPFVEPGERVEIGQVVCIIEAMKLMNEIPSDVAGRIVRVEVENKQPVEFSQVLFVVAPD